MNRAERRRQERQIQKRGISKGQLAEMKIDIVDELITKLFAVVVMTMKKRRYPKDRIYSFCNDMAAIYNNFEEGSESLEEYKNMVYEYTGMKFERGTEST